MRLDHNDLLLLVDRFRGEPAFFERRLLPQLSVPRRSDEGSGEALPQQG